MSTQILKALGIAGILGVCLYCRQDLSGQGGAPPPPLPEGVEVMARGPVHEAFATPTADPQPTRPVPRKPPLPIEEMPPEEKPEGEVIWIAGYHHWDDDRNDYLWVSGCWRIKPPGRDWVPGYWREQGEQWQWVPGFWTETAAQQAAGKEVVYHPEPPAPPAVAPPGPPPNADSFYVPGHWVWNGDRYAWRAGYWAHVQPGYIWVPAHYRWTPYGYVHIAGYWDLAVARRGMLYAPVVVNTVVVGPRFVYTPTYAVADTIVLDAMFIRPNCCHYYYGDYYGPRYRDLGYETCVVYSRTHYEPIVVYRTWEYRENPRWLEVQLTLHDNRYYGRAAPPPRNITQVNVYYNTTVVAPTAQVARARGVKTVVVVPAERQRVAVVARERSVTVIEARRQAERPVVGRPLTAPRTVVVPVKAAGTPHPQPPVVHPTPHVVQPIPKAPGPQPKINPPPKTLVLPPRPPQTVPPRPQPQPQPKSGKRPPDEKKN